MKESMAVRIAQQLMQEIAHKVSALLSSYPPQAHVFVVAVMQNCCRAMAARFDETDRKLLESLLEHAETVTIDLTTRRPE